MCIGIKGRDTKVAIRNNSPVLVIVWPDNTVEVTQVTAENAICIAKEKGAILVKVVMVQTATPLSIKAEL